MIPGPGLNARPGGDDCARFDHGVAADDGAGHGGGLAYLYAISEDGAAHNGSFADAYGLPEERVIDRCVRPNPAARTERGTGDNCGSVNGDALSDGLAVAAGKEFAIECEVAGRAADIGPEPGKAVAENIAAAGNERREEGLLNPDGAGRYLINEPGFEDPDAGVDEAARGSAGRGFSTKPVTRPCSLRTATPKWEGSSTS